jgi:hypothetical protein
MRFLAYPGAKKCQKNFFRLDFPRNGALVIECKKGIRADCFHPAKNF